MGIIGNNIIVINPLAFILIQEICENFNSAVKWSHLNSHLYFSHKKLLRENTEDAVCSIHICYGDEKSNIFLFLKKILIMQPCKKVHI